MNSAGPPPAVHSDHGAYPPYGTHMTGASAAAPRSDLFDLRFLLGVLVRRKFMILGIMALVTAAAALYVNQITPLYKGEAQLLIESDRENVVDIQEVVQSRPTDSFTMQTQAALVGSREMAGRVVDSLGLTQNPQFMAQVNREPGLIGSLAGAVGAWFSDVAGGDTADAPDRPRTPRDDVVDTFLDYLTVRPWERSWVLSVTFEFPDPVLAANAANAVVRHYVDSQREDIGAATDEANVWLDTRVQELQRRLIEGETAMEAFRREHGLVGDGDVSIVREQLSDFSSQLISARTNAAELRTRYEQVASLRERSPGEILTAEAVQDSGVMQTLRLTEVEIQRRIAELSTRYRDRHPKMVEARADLADLQARIRIEVDQIAANLRNEWDIAERRVANLEDEIGRLQAVIDDQNAAEVDLQSLSSEVNASRQLYETLLTRLAETDVQDETLQRPDARIVATATPAARPHFPNKPMIVTLAALVALVFSVMLALLIEFMDSGIRSMSQIESLLGQAALGLVPALTRPGKGESPHKQAVAQLGSIYSEAIRTVRTALSLSNPDLPPRVVLVTSSVPQEGKTSTVLSIAAQMAKTGQRSIVVDCDLRQSAVHVRLGRENAKGVGEFLVGAAEIDEVVYTDPDTGMHYIPAGSATGSPVELLGSERMDALLRALAQNYHLVLLDTPPVLAVSDALVLMRRVDATVFLVRWEKTRRDAATAGVKRTLEAGANLVGVALTQVDVKRLAKFSYYDSGYYYAKDYKGYYTTS